MPIAQLSKKIGTLVVVALPIKGCDHFCLFAVNRDSGIHPIIFLGVILPWNSWQNVCDSNGLEERAIIGSGTTDEKGVVVFRNFAADRDFGTYHMLFLEVKLP